MVSDAIQETHTVAAEDLPYAPMSMQCYVHVKSQFRGKNIGSSFEKFPSLVLLGNTTTVTAPCYAISSLLYVSDRLREVKNKNFILLALK